MELYGIKYLKNVKYANKKFYIDKTINNDIEDIDLYLDNYSFDNYENITCEKVYDTNPILYCKTLHSCYSIALLEFVFTYYCIINDLKKKYSFENDFELFIREKEYKLYPKQNNYLFDNSVNNYKYAWRAMSELITKNIIFENTIQNSDSLIIKNLFIKDNDIKYQFIYTPRWYRSVNTPVIPLETINNNLKLFVNHVKKTLSITETIISDEILIIQRKESPINNGLRQIKYLENILNIISSKNIKYKIVYLEDIPFKEQVSLFSTYKTIVSAHGSAITNCIFSTNTTIVEIFFNEKDNKTFKSICNAVDVNIVQLNNNNEKEITNYFNQIVI
tara:strand:+ start:1663 stop:2661 length:999 start_codon:yes stop_codon:yes gene_type:complete